MSNDERETWLRDREALRVGIDRRRVWAATALAGEAGGEAADEEAFEPVETRASTDDEPSSTREPLHRGGTALGRAVHAVLQSVDFDEPSNVAQLAAVHAAAEGLTGPGDVVEVERRVSGALESSVLREARSVPPNRRWRELYVGAPVSSNVPGGLIVEGYIDLLFEDDQGELVVVDYKTDRALTPAEAAEVASRYRVQAAAYALAVGEVLHRPVSRAVLVFCGRDGAVEHEIDDLPGAVALARDIATGSERARSASS
jgi:ATP-dependent helicase/nuclease subunit A